MKTLRTTPKKYTVARQANRKVRKNPPSDATFFDSLSSAELSLRLQTALQKYRDEKAKATEMGQRLEEALREVGPN